MDEREARGWGRVETIEGLSDLLHAAQGMGHRLASETHEDAYDLVCELNVLLHESRTKLELIKMK